MQQAKEEVDEGITSGSEAEGPPPQPLPRAATGPVSEATDPYQVEHEEHQPLPGEPGSPPVRPARWSARVELPAGRRICLALAHDGCAPRVVHYAAKLLLRSPDDRVELVHVRERAPSPGFGFPHLGGHGRGHGRAASAGVGLAAALPGGQLTPPPAPPEAPAAAGSQGSQPPGGWMQRQLSGGREAAAPGSQEAGAGGEGFAIAAAGHQPHPPHPQQQRVGQQEEGCAELLERCQQQLLGESRRVRPERVAVRLLAPAKHAGKALVDLLQQARAQARALAACAWAVSGAAEPEPAHILVLGSSGHSLGAKSKLWALLHTHSHGHGGGGGGGGTAAYCRDHLPGTRLVVLRPEEHLE